MILIRMMIIIRKLSNLNKMIIINLKNKNEPTEENDNTAFNHHMKKLKLRCRLHQ